MWSKDLVDTLMVCVWVFAWSALVYLMPMAGI